MNNNLENNIVFAPLRLRLVSFFIDGVCLALVLAVFSIPLSNPIKNNLFISEKQAQQFEILTFCILFGFLAYFWAKNLSPGKQILGLKLINLKTGNTPNFTSCLLRVSFMAITLYFLYLSSVFEYHKVTIFMFFYISLPFNSYRLGVHDIIAKTAVIYSNAPEKVLSKKYSIILDIITLIFFGLLFAFISFASLQ